MWIKLDFTPLFVGGLLLGLLLIGIGLALRWNVPKAAGLGVCIAIVGAIPALLGGFLLISDSLDRWHEKQRGRTWIEQLPEDREIQGIRFPRGTKVQWIGADMDAAMLSQPLEILGVPFEGKVEFSNTSGAEYVHLATELDKGTLATDHLIDGVVCKAHKEVEFYRGGPFSEGDLRRKAQIGKLRRCTLGAELEFKGNRYQADSEVKFNRFDGVELGILAVDQDVDGHWCKGGTGIERPEERAVRLTLARDESIGGVACKAGVEVKLVPADGRVISAVLSKDQVIDGIPCRGGEAVGFGYDFDTEAFTVDSCVLGRDFTILDVAWPAGSSLEALSRGNFKATLPSDSSRLTIGEVKFVGQCTIYMKKIPPALDHASADEKGYAELRGARFDGLNFYEGTSYGHIREAVTIDGIAYAAGALVRFNIGPQK